MFYDKQPVEHQENYKNMLKILGSLSRLFSEADEPYLYYRAHENVFAKYFKVDNNARHDDSADAYDSRSGIGIGLKTWVGGDNQKVAEFGRLRPKYEHLNGMELIQAIAGYRNARIRTTMNAHDLNEMLYHIVKRIPGAMRIYESTFDEIDIKNIILDEKRGNANSTYFTDGNHTYKFSRSKNTLYMIFDDMELLDEFEVEIYEDPYDVLSELVAQGVVSSIHESKFSKNQLCLRLYSTKPDGTKFVASKSGLNQWNGFRTSYRINENGEREITRVTPRDSNEVYIPYPAEDRRRKEFFPPKDEAFSIKLPNGKWISAKVCQQGGKAIMSNPNNLLGQWLLRDVFELEEGTQVTYDMLRIFNVDSIMFTKIEDHKYTVDFCELGTYERFYGLEDSESENEENDLT
ncbi:hypothetical protein J7S27_04230 [Carnobacteriaceae bacterium zg-C25]|nr:hypothetical protein J7S27_04230 [Carnobacteriaceae bacterium zg-C25]